MFTSIYMIDRQWHSSKVEYECALVFYSVVYFVVRYFIVEAR